MIKWDGKTFIIDGVSKTILELNPLDVKHIQQTDDYKRRERYVNLRLTNRIKPGVSKWHKYIEERLEKIAEIV